MRHTIISVTRAKAKLLEILRSVNDQGKAFILTKDGNPLGALVPMEDYDSLLETLDVLANSQTLKDIKAALADESKLNLWKKNSAGKWTRVKKKTKRLTA